MMVATVDILIKHCGYVELALVSTVATSITRGKVQVEGKEGKRREGGRVEGGRESIRREGG